MYQEESIRQFTDELASSASMPGGGTAAASGGAMGAALLSMVCNLTIGKEKFRDVEAALKEVLAETEQLRLELLGMMDEDADSFNRIIAAYRLPKNTPEETDARAKAIQQAIIGATEVPLKMVEKCARVVELSMPVAEKGNVGAVSDAGVGALLAEAALLSAAFNIKINLRSIKDAAFAEKARSRMETLVASASETCAKAVKVVDERLGA